MAGADGSQAQRAAEAAFLGRLLSARETAARYEDPALQAKARAVVPVDRLRAAACALVLASCSPDAASPPPPPVFLFDAFMKVLLRWWKDEFFVWVNSPPCERCGAPTAHAGQLQPNAEERRFGAGRVEAHKCSVCSAVTRFPRYNDPGRLLETRRGRCGEYANAFTLTCRALGITARYVVDWTDHVWTEVWDSRESRWKHADSCEAAYDEPLLYDAGWGKKLSYVFAASARDGMSDVAPRYVVSWADAASRRTAVRETWLADVLETSRRAVGPSAARRAAADDAALAARRGSVEAPPPLASPGAGAAASAPLAVAAAQQLPGRESGDVEWRRARGELGGGGGDSTARARVLAAMLAVAMLASLPQHRQHR